jgi:hypothetical protein
VFQLFYKGLEGNEGLYLRQSPRFQVEASQRPHPRPPLLWLGVQLLVVLWIGRGGGG